VALRALRLGPVLAAGLLAACAQWPETPPPATASQSASGAKIAKLAEAQVGSPYRYGGDSPTGFDCSGLVYYVYTQAGVSVPRTAEAQFDHLPRVERRDLQPGDLVFFRGEGNGGLHVGVYIGSGWFVHAPDSGKAVEGARLDNPYWHSRYLGAGRSP
jgi:murein DD-endopeptidase